MALGAGTRIGPFTIASLLGSGGMGEVYRARDTRLNRDVALKVLPEAFLMDPDRLSRFIREARVLASLSHPNIAAIHGLEESDGIRALVLELVEGPTLAERIAGGAIPPGEALSLARSLADALEAAHRQGIVHRDLKPANIKIRLDGTLKVLDFGLARALDRPGDRTATAESPTLTDPATGTGVLLGTAGYMSPEQARAGPVDHQADIWAFGCVLFEMLTGRRAFGGRTSSDAIAAILRAEPDWSGLPPGLHPRIRLLLERCLEKDTAARYHSIADARVDIDKATANDTPAPVPPPPRREQGGRALSWAALGAAIAAATIGVIGWIRTPPLAPRVERFAHVLPESESFVATTHGLVAVSPDGASFVYSANGSLFLRRLDQIEARPIEGTSGDPRSPFFSPDGRAIGYHDFRGGALRRIAIGGGAPVTLAAVTNMFGARWGADDTIVFAQEDGIWRIPAGGGTATQVLGIARDERVHAPQLLPDGKTVLFTLRREVGSREWMNAQIVTQSLDGAERRVIVAGRDGRYLPTGHLVYAMKSVLMGVRFDLGTMQAVGAPVPLVEGLRLPVEFPGTVGTANYDLSDTGTLVYVASGPPATAARELVAVDRRGNATPLLPEMRDYWRPRLSPDGTRLVVEVSEDDSSQLWIVTVKDGVAAPLTSDGTINVFAAWSPDSRSVIHRSNRAGTYGIYRQAIDGLSAPQLLYRSPEDVIPGDVARDGTVVFAAGEQTGRRAIYSIPLSGGEPKPVVATPVLEHMPAFSPDGAWLAYVSNETGRNEVYIRLLDAPEGTRRRVSQDGGTAPVWSRDGRELFYRAANGYLTAVPTRLDRAMALGRPEALFEAEGRFRSSGNAPAYDVDASGRFIMVTEVERPPFARQIRVVLNWHEELNALLPAR